MTDADSSFPAAKGGSRSGRRWLRRVAWTLGTIVVIYFLVVLALLGLARGGEAAFVWHPPTTPSVSATGEGAFQITATPATGAVDMPVSITVDGLEPGAPVLVIASTLDARDIHFESWAKFVADDQGRLSLDDTAPESGTYGGKDGNGLLWSMRAADGSLFYTSMSWENREYKLSVISEGARADVVLERGYPFAGVSREVVRGDRWSGELTVPKSGGTFPVVIALAGWDDGPMQLTSALIARRGYAVLNLGYHGWEGLPEELVEVPIESVTDAIDWVETRSELDSSKIGVYGISRGAELALVAASRDSRITAVAAWAPSSEVFSGISFRSIRQRSSWSWGGQATPFARAPINRDTVRVAANLMLRRPTAFRPTYAAALAASDGTSTISIERITGAVLLVAGAKDLVWPSAKMSQQIATRAEALGADVNVTTLVFDEAGHALNYSLWPAGDFSERQMIRGGTPEANHLAGQHAWAETLAFFARQLDHRH